MVKICDNRFRYALEAREPSWFDNKVYDILKDNKLSLTWSVRDELKTPPILHPIKSTLDLLVIEV